MLCTREAGPPLRAPAAPSVQSELALSTFPSKVMDSVTFQSYSSAQCWPAAKAGAVPKAFPKPSVSLRRASGCAAARSPRGSPEGDSISHSTCVFVGLVTAELLLMGTGLHPHR